MKRRHTDSSPGDNPQDRADDRTRPAQLQRLSEAGFVEETIRLTAEITCFGEARESDLFPIHPCGVHVSSPDNPKHFYVYRKRGIYFVIPAVSTIDICVNGRHVPTPRFLQTGDVITCTACQTDFLARTSDQNGTSRWLSRSVGLLGLGIALLLPFLDQIRQRPFDLSTQTLTVYSFASLLAILSIASICGTIPRTPRPHIPKHERKVTPVPKRHSMERDAIAKREKVVDTRMDGNPAGIETEDRTTRKGRIDEVR